LFEDLSRDPSVFMNWTWDDIQARYDVLLAFDLRDDNAVEWLSGWTELGNRIGETYSRLSVATTQNTADKDAEARFNAFLENILPNAMRVEQQMKEKLLATGIEPVGYGIQLANLREDAEVFREANIPLLTDIEKLRQEYDQISGAQTVEFEGEERTMSQLLPFLLESDRGLRERAWRAEMDRRQQDRAAFNDLWTRFLKLRLQIAENAGMDYTTYTWKTLHRADYSPEDCVRFQQAIEEAVVPAAERIYERRRQQLGVETLRPWDSEHRIHADPLGRPPLRPYTDLSTFISRSSTIFHQVDDALGDYYDIMMEERLLDLENRRNKAPGGYCTTFDVAERPFIFQNAVGIHDDVQTLLHEGGHAFHAFEMFRSLPPYQRGVPPMEFCEVASMSMELLAAPYLDEAHGGFYPPSDAARARIEHLEGMITFWPYMAVVDAFQHWVYTHPQEALDPANCDAEWTRQWHRFMRGIDYSGLEDIVSTGWHRKLHIFQIPFYYVEYGIAQLGAAQVYANALIDQANAVRQYRAALALGGTQRLPALFDAAGARFSLDTATVGRAVAEIEGVITALEQV